MREFGKGIWGTKYAIIKGASGALFSMAKNIAPTRSYVKEGKADPVSEFRRTVRA